MLGVFLIVTLLIDYTTSKDILSLVSVTITIIFEFGILILLIHLFNSKTKKINQKYMKPLAFLLIFLVLSIFIFGIIEVIPEIYTLSEIKQLLFGQTWNPKKENFGAFNLFMGSMIVTFYAIIIVIPFGLSIGIFMAEFVPENLYKHLKSSIELISAIPSVIMGLISFKYFAKLIKSIFFALGVEQQYSVGNIALTASITLAFMTVPMIASLTDDALRSVPKELKKSALALGSSHWEVIARVSIPYNRSSISSAIILAFGRIFGETMVVLMVAGSNPALSKGLLNPLQGIYALPAAIALEVSDVVVDDPQWHALFYLGLELLTISFVITVLGRRIASGKLTFTSVKKLFDKTVGSDSKYDYHFIPGRELINSDQIWQVNVPYGVKRIERIGGGNFLVVSRSNLSNANCPITPKSREDEEIISIVSRGGTILNKLSIGNRYLHAIYKSRDGNLISIVSTGYDDTAESMIIDENGNEYLTAHDAVLYPSSNGNYLVSRRAARPARIPWDNEIYSISSESKITKYNLRNIFKFIKGKEEDTVINTNVLWAFDNDILLLCSRKNDNELIHSLNLYEIGTGKLIWKLDKQNALNVTAVTRSEENEEYILLDHWLNEDKIFNTIIRKSDGAVITNVINGEVWSAIGSRDGFFYGNVKANLTNGQLRSLIMQFTPQFEVLHFGLTYQNNILENPGELEGLVWGINKNVELGGKCYPFVTSIYDMRIDLPKRESTEERALPVNPVILEGVWVIDEITEDSVMLVGQIDPKDGVLRKIRVDRGLICL